MKVRALFIVFLFLPFLLSAQSKPVQTDAMGNYSIRMSLNDFRKIESNSTWDIMGVKNDSLDLYLKPSEVQAVFSQSQYRILPNAHITEAPKLSNHTAYNSQNFNTYPTYPQYDSIMMAFADSFPQIARYVVLGTLPSGRKIVALHISDHVDVKEAEPRFLYTSTMHGDETAGYIFMLKLIKHLLEGYGSDPEATALVDSVDIWINPLANPDGAYYGGNHTISQAIRNNANNVNLNRNYPDPEDGQHPDNNQWQAETMIFMGLADTLQFTLSSNLHGGAEVCNYPWDTWSRLPADASWWVSVCSQYADSVHRASNYNGYLTDFGSGVTNGYQWYSISGGRQDFMNYFHYCRELTLELSSTKLLPENLLDNYWNYNKRALLDYMGQINFGLRGFVRDSISGKPLKAKVFILNHDKDSSHVYSSALHGDYYRLLAPGYYSVQYSAAGYVTKQVDSVLIQKNQAKLVDIELSPKPNAFWNRNAVGADIQLFPNPVDKNLFFITKPLENAVHLVVYNAQGAMMLEVWLDKGSTLHEFKVDSWSSGMYFLQMKESCSAQVKVKKFMVQH